MNDSGTGKKPLSEEVIYRFEESLRRVQKESGEQGRIGGASRHLAESIVALKDWAAELPDDLAPNYEDPTHA